MSAVCKRANFASWVDTRKIEGLPPAFRGLLRRWQMSGLRDGAAWVADDVFVTHDGRGDVLVERWDGRGVRSAVVRRDSEGFMKAMWIKLSEIAVDGRPETAL